MQQLILSGRVKQGLRIASGLNPDPTLKLNNTIFLQKPFFKEVVGPRMDNIHNGTVNLHIGPQEFQILKPDHEITCEWAPGVTETFWLVGATIAHNDKNYDGYVYYPLPSAVKNHGDDTVELLAEKIPGLQYGDSVSVAVPEGKIRFA
jgi:hypothetical protein